MHLLRLEDRHLTHARFDRKVAELKGLVDRVDGARAELECSVEAMAAKREDDLRRSAKELQKWDATIAELQAELDVARRSSADLEFEGLCFTTNKSEKPQNGNMPPRAPARTYVRTATERRRCRWGRGCRNMRCKFLHPGQTYEPIPKKNGCDGDQKNDKDKRSCKTNDGGVEDKSRVLPPEEPAKGGQQRNEPRSPDKAFTAARGTRPENRAVKAFSVSRMAAGA